MTTLVRMLACAATVLLGACAGTTDSAPATADLKAPPSPSCFDRPMEMRVDGIPLQLTRLEGKRFRYVNQLGQARSIGIGVDDTHAYIITALLGTYKLNGSLESCELTGLVRFNAGNRGVSIRPAT